jgi:hypothetical protein
MLSKEHIPNHIVIIDQSAEEEVRRRNLASIANHTEKIDTNIEYIYQDKPSSTASRNTGFMRAYNEIVVYSDDDVDACDDTFYNVAELMFDGGVSLIAGIDDNTPPSASSLGYLFGTKSYRQRAIGHVTASMLGRYPDSVKGEVRTRWAMGYFFAVKKSCAERWGILWDERLTGYAYAEDLDYTFSYCKQSEEENLRCILSDKVRVRHLASNEHRTPSQRSTYAYVINREYLSGKHKMGVRSYLAMRWSNFAHMLLRLLKKQNAGDLLRAQIKCNRNKKRIRRGEITPDLYEG